MTSHFSKSGAKPTFSNGLSFAEVPLGKGGTKEVL